MYTRRLSSKQYEKHIFNPYGRREWNCVQFQAIQTFFSKSKTKNERSLNSSVKLKKKKNGISVLIFVRRIDVPVRKLEENRERKKEILKNKIQKNLCIIYVWKETYVNSPGSGNLFRADLRNENTVI